jgi:hypothetical protein
VIAIGRLRSAAQDAVALSMLARREPSVPASRWTSLVRAGYGAALLCMPGHLITAVTGFPASRRARVTARVLGARHLAQAAICGAMPVRGLIQAGSAADCLHAASMLVLAGNDRRQRAALVADAQFAAVFAAAGAASLHG